MKQVGVLALQGAFIEHEKMLEQLGVSCIELRNKEDLEKPYDGIILPGGESTVQGKLLKELDMFDTITKQIEAGMPVLATCAGLILLAKDIKDQEETYFGTIPMCVTKCIWKTARKLLYNKRSRWSRRSPNDIYPRTICGKRRRWGKSISRS